MTDWGLGAYERIADQLAPAAEALVDAAAIQPGEAVLDVGCGSGTAAVAAARRGAIVRGVDPSERLVQAAVATATAARVAAAFAVGEAADLPVSDRSADVVLSNFGVIFAEDATAAISELTRVARGRIAFTAWVPGRPLSRVAGLRRPASPCTGAEPPFAWHDEDVVARAFARLGYMVSVEERELAFGAELASAFMAQDVAYHPMWAEARRELRSERAFSALVSEAQAVLADA